MNEELISKYRGREIARRIADEGMRRGFIANWDHMAGNYGRGVDAQLLENQIMLCDETYEELYRAPEPTRYVRGTRPILERVADKIAAGARNETECAIGVMRYTRDLYKKRRGWHPFFGGTEEVLIEKGEELCECVSRLAVALLETIGIPARIITHTIGGHVTAEAWADGKWGYIDPRCGMYFLLPDGRLASLWELWHDHSILDSQPDGVADDVSPRFPYDGRIDALKRKYLSPLEVNTYKYYSLADADKYDYSWNTDEDCMALGMNLISKNYGTVRNEVMFGIKPDGAPRKYDVRFTLHDGVTLSEDVMLGVRLNGTMCHPTVARFYLDGELTYSTPDVIPISELSTHQHGVILYGGASGSLPVSTLSDGSHTLCVELEVAPEVVVSKELSFTVKH